MKPKNLLPFIAAACLALLAGCATSHLPTSSEVAVSDFSANEVGSSMNPVNSIAVFLVSDNHEERTEWEDSFSASMNDLGIKTQPTYGHLPAVATLENPDEIRKMYRETGAQSGLTVELIQAQSQKALKATKATGAVFWAALLLDQPLIADGVSVANLASYNEARQYQLRLTLWNAENQSKIWSMDTQSFTTFGVASKDASIMAETVSGELRAKGLVL